MTERCLSFANEEKQNRAHKKTGKENADGNERTELREAHRTAQNQSQKTDGGGERAKKNGAAKFRHRRGDGLAMRLSIAARLLITPKDQDRKIDAQSDQDRAEPDRHHAEPAKKKKTQRQRHQT